MSLRATEWCGEGLLLLFRLNGASLTGHLGVFLFLSGERQVVPLFCKVGGGCVGEVGKESQADGKEGRQEFARQEGNQV